MPMVDIDPERSVTDEQLAAIAPDDKMNGPFIADVLSDMLMHERCGFHLYRSVAGRTNNPMLKSKYEHFGEETRTHITVLEDLITELGGDPGYVSPAARATEKIDMGTLEASFLLSGSVDLMTQELVMLNSVLLAEAMDHANWTTMAAMVEAMPHGAPRAAAQAAVDRVLPQEEEHIGWARDMRQKMILGQASSKAMAKAGAKAEELVDRIKDLFS